MKNERNTYLDFAKGIAILLVLWGHCIEYGTVNGEQFFYNPVFKIIYSFHMPLFMFISGYLFFYSVQKYKLKELLYNRFKSLGISLFIWGCIPYALTLFYFHKYLFLFYNQLEVILDGN